MKKNKRILIAEGNSANLVDQLVSGGGISLSAQYERALRFLDNELECVKVYPSEQGPDCLPVGQSVSGFDGVVWTGSGLYVNDETKEIRNQKDLAQMVVDADVPTFGSCWGLQLFTAVLGGKVQHNPKGWEVGIGRNILQSDTGRGHPIYAGKPASFDAITVHMDEVCELPMGATVLASNRVSDVQAMEVLRGKFRFWGVQYHPELELTTLSGILRLIGPVLVKEGLCEDEKAVEAMADDWLKMGDHPTDLPSLWRQGIDDWVADPHLRMREISNWLSSL